jgi:hypothetical protein
VEKLKHALAVVLEKIGNVTGALRAEQRVITHQHKTWGRALKKAERYEKQADEKRAAAQQAKKGSRARRKRKAAAQHLDVKAQKQHRKAEAAKLRAQPSIHEAKRLARRVHDLEQDEAEIRKELAGLTGGGIRAKVVKVALESVANCAGGRRPNRYTQAGAWSVNHALDGEPIGYRSDCSQWSTSVSHEAGAPDPNDNDYRGGFTGTILTGGHSITRNQLRPGDDVIYGSGNGFHTERYVGDGHPNHSLGQTGNQRTAGHGSPPVDFGIVDLIPGVETRYRRSIHD